MFWHYFNVCFYLCLEIAYQYENYIKTYKSLYKCLLYWGKKQFYSQSTSQSELNATIINVMLLKRELHDGAVVILKFSVNKS